MIRFSANVSILFTEVPFLDRFERARRAGFSAVEFWWPGGENVDEVEKAVRDAGVEVALFNFDAGDMSAGDRGLLSDPSRVGAFQAGVPGALDLALRLGCRRMNALVGLRRPELRLPDQLALAREVVAWTADRARRYGVTVTIEAINTYENGPYLLSTTRQAAGFIESVGRDNVRLQYDVYHMQRMEGNLTATMREYIGRIEHIQIADSPGRGEPGTGEIHFRFLFAELQRLAYDGFVGLEYRPSRGDTEASLAWLPESGRSRSIPAESLKLGSPPELEAVSA